ncbi:MAG: hypothetical protein ACHQTE_00085 [Candidatus Saccharimonadales bacterium]
MVAIAAKPIIAVDCDDVVANVNDGMRQFINDTYGTRHSPEDYRATGEYWHYWEKLWQISDTEAAQRFEHFITSGRMRHLDLVTGALGGLAWLKDRYDLIMVTARSEAEVEFTHFWLKQSTPGIFKDVIFVHTWDTLDKKATKADICLSLGATYLVDDNYDHCRLAAEAGLQALLFGDYGWNRAAQLGQRITRVRDWREVKEFFDAKGQ